MEFNEYIIKLNCSFCGKPQSEAVVSAQFGWTQQNATAENYKLKHGIVDTRCDSCVVEHGDFKAMVEAYVDQTGDDWAHAEEAVKANPSKADFDVALDARVQEVLESKTLDKNMNQPSDIIKSK